jgi:hypothetical protein
LLPDVATWSNVAHIRHETKKCRVRTGRQRLGPPEATHNRTYRARHNHGHFLGSRAHDRSRGDLQGRRSGRPPAAPNDSGVSQPLLSGRGAPPERVRRSPRPSQGVLARCRAEAGLVPMAAGSLPSMRAEGNEASLTFGVPAKQRYGRATIPFDDLRDTQYGQRVAQAVIVFRRHQCTDLKAELPQTRPLEGGLLSS